MLNMLYVENAFCNLDTKDASEDPPEKNEKAKTGELLVNVNFKKTDSVAYVLRTQTQVDAGMSTLCQNTGWEF